MTFKPPWSLPTTDGTDVGAPVMQAPPAVHLTIEASKGWLDMMGSAAQQVGDQIVDFYSSNIAQFVQSQRRQNAIGGLEQSSRWMTVPGLDLNHVRAQGREIIRIVARPESAPSESFQINTDINLDGYIVWTSLYGDQSVGQARPVDIVLNGFGVFTNFVPTGVPSQLFTPAVDPVARPETVVTLVIAFGETALRCQSLQDDAHGFNPFTLNKGSGGPAPKVLPSRPDVKASGGVPSHKDLLGYFLFKWGDQLNPDSWAYNGAIGQGPRFTYDANFPPATILKIIQFKTVADSPLKALGMNHFFTQGSVFPSGDGGLGFVGVEFFNRAVLRPVAQSWKLQVNSPRAVLLANDKPLYFAIDGGNPFTDIPAHTLIGLKFDLSSVAQPAQEATFGNASQTIPEFSQPLTAAEQAVQDANNAAEAIHFAAFQAASAALNTTQNNFAIANLNIRNLGASGGVGFGYNYVQNPTPTNFGALVAVFPNQAKRDAIVTYCTASVAFQANPSSSNAAAFVAAENNALIASIVVGDFVCVIANSDVYQYSISYSVAYDKAILAGKTVAQAIAAGLAAASQGATALTGAETAVENYATSQGRSDLATAAASALTALISAENAYFAILPLFNPQHIIADNFQSIDGFNHRIITVANGQFSIGAWSGG